jgi:hypothetical protein
VRELRVVDERDVCMDAAYLVELHCVLSRVRARRAAGRAPVRREDRRRSHRSGCSFHNRWRPWREGWTAALAWR